MESALSRLAVASQRAPGFRSFQILKRHDELRLRAFFLSFDFDQRRAYFGGGMSDPAIREYCETIDWENMTIIARSGPACIDAVVILASLPPAHTTAKLSLACLLSGNQTQVVRELLDLAIDVAALELVSRSHRALRKLGIVILELMLNGVHLVPHRASRAAGPLAEARPDASHPSNEFSTSMPLP